MYNTRLRTFILICFAMSFSIHAQTKIDAQARRDLNFKTNTRVLFTTLDSTEAFETQHPQWSLSLKKILTEHLHTTIVLGQKENLLQSYDRSRFPLEADLSALKLTEMVIQKIGGMYYGKKEVERLRKKKKQ